MIQIISRIIIIASVIIFGTIIRMITKKRKINKIIPQITENETKYIIKQLKSWFIGTLFSTIILLSILVICIGSIIEYQDDYIYILYSSLIFGSLIIFTLSLTIYSAVWKIEVYESKLSFRNMFGRTRFYNFEDIEIKLIRSGLRVYKKREQKKRKHIVGVYCIVDNYKYIEKNVEVWEKKNKQKVIID